MAITADRLAIEFISAFALPPDQFVAMAAEFGVRQIGMAPAPITANPHGYPAWNLLSDAALRRATRDALSSHDVAVSLGEGLLIMPGTEIADSERIVDLMAGLGAPLINCVVIEQDRARATDQFAQLAQMAQVRGLLLSLEFMPMMWPASLSEAAAFVTTSGAANARLMIDAMHFFRSGATPADLANIDPALIGHIQICDVPMPARSDNYGEEARHERLCPGEGDLPLAALLAALPRDVTVGIECPMLSKMQAGIAPARALVPCVIAARELLSAFD